MKFLIDENLPVALADWLRRQGVEAFHVREVGLAAAADRKIVLRARREQEIIVTQDGGLTAEAGGDPSLWLQIVQVRLGNTSTAHLLDVWAQRWDGLRASLERGDEQVEVGDDA